MQAERQTSSITAGDMTRHLPATAIACHQILHLPQLPHLGSMPPRGPSLYASEC